MVGVKAEEISLETGRLYLGSCISLESMGIFLIAMSLICLERYNRSLNGSCWEGICCHDRAEERGTKGMARTEGIQIWHGGTGIVGLFPLQTD